MTKRQRREHKLWNQVRRLRLLKLYYKVKPASRGWIAKPGFSQAGKYTKAAAYILGFSLTERQRFGLLPK